MKGGIVPTRRKFEVVKEMSAETYCLQLLCQVAGVSKSGYYKWLRKQKSLSEKQIADESVKEKNHGLSSKTYWFQFTLI